MATVPTPYDATAGAKASAAAMDAGVKDALNFLMSPPRVRCWDSVGISCLNNADTQLTWVSETYDTDAMHSTSVTTSRINFNTAGLYRVQCVVQWPTAALTGSNIHCRLNSAESNAGGTLIGNQVFTNARIPSMDFQRFFSAGDYIQFWILQITGGTISTTTGEYRTYMEASWMATS
jgi:hypothetical protein